MLTCALKLCECIYMYVCLQMFNSIITKRETDTYFMLQLRARVHTHTHTNTQTNIQMRLEKSPCMNKVILASFSFQEITLLNSTIHHWRDYPCFPAIMNGNICPKISIHLISKAIVRTVHDKHLYLVIRLFLVNYRHFHSHKFDMIYWIWAVQINFVLKQAHPTNNKSLYLFTWCFFWHM